MFFLISKILAFLLSPLMWIMLLLLVGIIVIKNTRRARRYFISAFVCFIFFTNPAIIDELLRWWESPMIVPAANQQYDAGIVLGGGMVTFDNDYNRLIFRENTDRFLQTYALYKKGTIKKIIVSGGAGSLVFKNTIEATLIKRYLLDVGVPSDDVIIDSTSNNTHENAVNCVKIINEQFPGKHFLLITSATHMRRSLACFDNEKLCVSPYPVGKIVGPRRTDIGYYLVPDTEALIRWEKLLHELLGYVIYTAMGYI